MNCLTVPTQFVASFVRFKLLGSDFRKRHFLDAEKIEAPRSYYAHDLAELDLKGLDCYNQQNTNRLFPFFTTSRSNSKELQPRFFDCPDLASETGIRVLAIRAADPESHVDAHKADARTPRAKTRLDHLSINTHEKSANQ